MRLQKITPFLWFDNQAEEAARFYTSVFPNSAIRAISRYSDAGPGPKGSVMTVSFDLDGQQFVALNGGPHFHFTEAVSFVVNCEDQREVDAYWEKLLEGGQESQCGWLKDKFGLSWQIVPIRMFEMLEDSESEGTQRAFKAMLKMKKLDLPTLEKAYFGTVAATGP